MPVSKTKKRESQRLDPVQGKRWLRQKEYRMTTTITVEADDLERIAFAHGLSIELDTDAAYLVLDGLTFRAALAEVPA